MGPGLAAMAWRNLWRNRRRTLITLSGIAFGVMLAVLMTSLGDGTYRDMIQYAARMGSGHVSIEHPEYNELPSVKKTVTGTAELIEKARAQPEVTAVRERISGAVMIATAANSTGAFFMGIDPEVETDATFQLRESVKHGEYFETSRDSGIILGVTLAENLGLKVGKKLVYTLTDKDGEIRSEFARVTGMIESGAPSIDAGMVLLPIDTARKNLGYAPDEVTQVAIFVGDNRDADAVSKRLGEELGGDDVAVLTWKENQAELYGMIQMKLSSNLIFEVILILLVGAGIFNTLFVSVMERRREFGIMIATGFSQLQVFALVLWESLWLGIVGLLFAVMFTAGPYYHLATTGLDITEMYGDSTEVAGVAMEPIMYAFIYPEKLVVIALVVVLATVAAGIYPAWKAGRVQPVEAIKLV